MSFLGLDLGTSGVRGLALDARGRVLAAHALPLPSPSRPAPGYSEQDPALWWETAAAVLRTLCGRLEQDPPEAVAVDGTSGTLLLVGGNGVPTGPALMYDDRRAEREAARVAAVAPPEAPVHGPASPLARLLWLLRHRPPPPGSRVLHQAEWISGRLLGRFDLGDENNCLKLGHDPVHRRWPDWLERLELPAGLLPQVREPGEALGPTAPAAAAETGLPAGCLVAAGTTDSTAAALAAGLEQEGDALTSLGSTLVTKVLSPAPLFHAGHGIYSHRILGRWLAGGASNSGGRVLLRHFDPDELERLSRRIDPRRAICLDYYPLPEPGERFPVNDPRLEPRLTPVPADRARFLQGMLEGMARIEKRAYARLEALGAPAPRRILTSGGGARNAAWQAIRRRVLGVPVERAAGEPALGAALLAARAAGLSGLRP